MSYLLDTNVISELVKPKPAEAVMEWFSGIPDRSLHLSVLTIGEIRKGIEKLDNGKRKESLRLWLEHDLSHWFGNRILSLDAPVADRWGRLLAQTGRTMPTIDSLLAATALHHELRMVTRNHHDFEYPGLEVVNPFA
ncbi:MAG: type II toxin-antitoxin system VapC family toxin [Desulfovibrionales bacterium]